jgi:hypothetical protein
VFFPSEELSLNRELITAYIVDDLEHLEQRRGSQRGLDDPLFQRMQRVMTEVLQLSSKASQARPAVDYQEASEQTDERLEERRPPWPIEKVDEQQALEPLFALMARLRQHPELIPVASDFIRELATDG